MTNFLIALCVFDVKTNFLTSWSFFLVHDKLVLSLWRVFGVMTNFLTSWRIYDVLTNVMKNFFYGIICFFGDHDVFLMSWQTLWRHVELFDVMTCFWCYKKLFEKVCHDVAKHKNKPWQTFWRIFDVMTYFLTSWRVFGAMTNFLTLWLTFSSWR